MPGVVRTRVGYCGGTMVDPNYRSMGDHTETFEIDYDPNIIRYSEILDYFFEIHNATFPMPRQYMSLILVHDDEQKVQSEQKILELEAKRGKNICTEVRAYDVFYWAEDYHQKYFLRYSILEKHFLSMYPNNVDFVNSTAVAILNGAVRNFCSKEYLLQLKGKLGISEEVYSELIDMKD